MANAEAGQLAMLIGTGRKSFIFTLKGGESLQTHQGIIAHDHLIGRRWGEPVESHLGHTFSFVQPTLRDLLLDTERRSQIVFPKDIGYILLRLSIRPGLRVLEAGTGSGALTCALAWSVGTSGHVATVDRRPDMQELAARNLTRLGLRDRVELIQHDVEENALELNTPHQALFLDLPDPQQALDNMLPNLEAGSPIGAILPTANQVSALLEELQKRAFADVDVCEILLRFYKTVPPRLRPSDRMVAHTGYLVFGRYMLPATEPAA